MEWLQFREPLNAWSHCAGLLFALPATWLLLRRSHGDRVKRIGFLIFGFTLALCYLGSTLFHGVRWPPEQLGVLAVLDKIGVYLFIAGTVTPIALVILRGAWRWAILALAWGMALAGTALRLLPIELSLAVSTATYLVMGWGVLLCYFQLARLLAPRAMRPALLGGIFYSMGAICEILNWPVLVPGVLAAHEVFHLFVLAGTWTHFWFMLTVVAPYAPCVCPG